MIAARAEGVKPSIGFNFVALPVELIRRNDVSPAAKLLLAVLMDSARGNRSGLSKLCNATLGARIGRSASEAGRHLAELEALGLIRREFGQSKRIRIGIAIAWVPEVQATSESTSTRSAQPGSANLVNRVQPRSATIQIPPSEPNFQTGPILSTLGEKTEADPKPTPSEIADALRAMAAGKYAPVIWPQPASTRPEPAPSVRVDPPRAVRERPPAPPRDSHDLARGIFVDARRAAYAKPGGGRRKTAAEQIAALRRRSVERGQETNAKVARFIC